MAGHYKSFHLPESKPHYLPPTEFHTVHFMIDLSLDFSQKSISGRCTLIVEPVKEGLAHLLLDAAEMDLSGVEVDGAPVTFEYDGRTLAVPLSGGLGGKRSVSVSYSARPRLGIHFIGPDEEHPKREVQAWSHNEPDSARFWFPCHDHPNDKSSSEIVLSVPKGFTVISNGKLLSTLEEGERSVFHWREDLPHSTYLTSFVAGKFGEITQDADGIKLDYHFPEAKRNDVLRYFGETPRMMKVFADLTGVKYPYPKYSQTTVEEFLFGGMENFNATTLATTYYPDAASEEDFQTSYSSPFTNAVNLVAHELAHQWFGDLVTCADWCHAWLNEGFATYFQALYQERTKGVDAMRWDLGARAEEYFEEDQKRYRRAIVERDYVHPDDLFDYTTYEKGASMLHQLRFFMGDDAFFKGISAYLREFSLATADSSDFFRALERTSGIALEEFVEQSFFKPGYPEFEVEYEYDDAQKAATVRVRQVQSLEGGTPIFKVPCEIVFYVGGEPQTHRVSLESASQTLSFAIPRRPLIVEFDPRRWLLKKVKFEKSLELLLNQLQGSREAWSRAEAAKGLGRLKSNAAIPGLKAAATKEQFWDVQASALRALGEIGSPQALEAILDVGLPKDRRVRRGLAEGLGGFKDQKARERILEILNTDESPYVRCEAALSLARSWPEGAFGPMMEAMKTHSPNETLAEACLEAMGKTGDARVKDVVKGSLPYGNPTRVRVGALKAIKGRGYIAEDEVPVLKGILAGDKEYRVRLYLVNDVIRELGDTRFVDAVEEAAEADLDSRIKRAALETYHELTSIAGVSGMISKLKTEVEELREENRRLGTRAT